MTKKRLLAGFGALVLAMGGCGGQPTSPDRAPAPEVAVTETAVSSIAAMGDSPVRAPGLGRTPPVAVTTVTAPPLPARPALPVSVDDGVVTGPPDRDTAPGAHRPPGDPGPVDVSRSPSDAGGDDGSGGEGSGGDDSDEDPTGGEDADGATGPRADEELDRDGRSGCTRMNDYFRDGHRVRGHWRCR